MALATLSIDLVAKLAELQTGMDKAGRIAEKNAAQIEARYKRMGDVARSVGAALGAAISVTGIAQFVKATVDGLDALNDLKDATGASIENLSALEDIAARTGTSMDSVGTALVKLNQVLNTAKPGSEAAKALQAIGLAADELRKLDPAEALLEISKALATYADDGEKARLVQLLFGKSIREVAPLLNDLAAAGKLNATVTTAQALEAEKFNKQLAALQKNATDAGRAITTELLPALIKYLGAVSRLPQNLGVLADGTKAMFDSETLKLAVSRVERLQDALNRNPGNERLATQLADARKEADRLLAAAFKTGAALRNMLPAPAPGAGGGRGFVNPEVVRQPITELPAGGGANGALSKRAGSPGPGYGPMGPFPLEQVNTPLSEAARDALRAIEATDVVKIQQINATLDQLFLLRATGGGREVDEAIDAMVAQLGALGPAAEQAAADVQPALDEISQFTQQAGRNIQDALGNTLTQTLRGDFDDIGKLWGDMLKRMVAEAAAADLMAGLFKKGSGGNLAGLFSAFGGFFADGGTLGAGKWGIAGERGPELIRGPAQIIPAGGGAGVTMATNIYIDSRTDQAQVAQMVAAGMAQSQRSMWATMKARGLA